MKPAFATVLTLATLTASALAAVPPGLDHYLPAGVEHDPNVPKPSSVLGFEVGEWHVRHDLLVAYMRALAEHSDRMRIEVTGRTHEARPLLLLTVSSPANLARLDTLIDEHLKLVDPTVPPPDTSSMPVFVYMGYSIHGNEASGSNAALAVAYHLAAAQGPAIDDLLDHAVIFLDPSLNPDGLGRFATWANMHRGRVLVDEPASREHREGWPNGRTNHYWFDLNRDWLPLVHPESRARLTSFHRLKPNVLTDHHEMGADETFFFQPGIPLRRHPLTPERNVELTVELARFHADALDEIGTLYFTEEIFDDYYYGKGSTYPDVHGTVGILFEQASVRGHLQDTVNGPLSFPDAIRNQVTTSLSTLRGALALRRELLDYQADFYRGALEEAKGFEPRAYVFGDPADPVRTHHLVELLRRHQVEVRRLGQAVEVDGERFDPEWAFVVPLEQTQFRLVRALFETRTEFADSAFYDVSTWTLPMAFGLPWGELTGADFAAEVLGEATDELAPPQGEVHRSVTAASEAPRTVAYLFEWGSYYAPRALHRLLDAEVRTRVATRPLTASTLEGRRAFGYGTIVVPLGLQDLPRPELEALLDEVAEKDAIDVWAATSGLTPEGIDLGSPSLEALALPKVALVVGSGVSTYAAGEIWHLLDQRFQMPVPLMERNLLPRTDLDRFTHLVLVDGTYEWADGFVQRLADWIRRGGVLIATQRAAEWASMKLAGAEAAAEETTEITEKPERRPYAEHARDRAAQLVSGAIFEAELDTTHPIAYGYARQLLPMFRNSRTILPDDPNPYSTVARYSDEPLLSGYVSSENHDLLRGTPAVIANRIGRGVLVRMVDDPNFRGFWSGTHKLFLNAIFFGPVIEPTPVP